MSGNVFLTPWEPEQFERTVGSAVDLSDHADRPDAISDAEAVRFAGVADRSNNRTYFEKMEPGDLVLFYDDESFVGAGWIGTTFVDEDGWASEAFWDGESAELVYTIEGFAAISVPIAAVNRVFDYAEGYDPGGLMRVADGRVTDEPAAIKTALERYTDEHA